MTNTITKGHELKKLAEAEIISCINTEGYDTSEFDGSFISTREKIEFLHSTFMKEVGHWNIPRVGFQKALLDWFQGLPSACTIPFYNYDIIELAVKWGSLPKIHTEKQSDKIVDNYWVVLGCRTLACRPFWAVRYRRLCRWMTRHSG